MNKLLVAEKLRKEYPLPSGVLTVFDDLDFSLDQGELVAVTGASGVGKTTLLNLFGALDSPTSGRVMIDGRDVFGLGEKEKASLRNSRIGFIFQFYHLLPEFTSVENVAFPLLIAGRDKKASLARSRAILGEVFLEEKADLRPSQLSGGEQQRLAIARALINDPVLLLADEPTGNLDWKTGKMILDLIQNLHAKRSLSSIIVTHNEKVAEFCQKIYLMESGRLKLLT